MKIAVVGAGAVGTAIARELTSHGNDVTLIEISPDAIHVGEAPKAHWVLDDASSLAALEEAGVRDVDALVAATGDDKVNLVVSLLGKTEFAVPKVVARVNDPHNEWMFDGSWGVDIPVSTPRVMAALVEETISTGRAVHLLSVANRNVDSFALIVPDDSTEIGLNPDQIRWPEELVITTLVRDGVPLALTEVTEIRPKDELLITCESKHSHFIGELEALFSSQPTRRDADLEH